MTNYAKWDRICKDLDHDNSDSSEEGRRDVPSRDFVRQLATDRKAREHCSNVMRQMDLDEKKRRVDGLRERMERARQETNGSLATTAREATQQKKKATRPFSSFSLSLGGASSVDTDALRKSDAALFNEMHRDQPQVDAARGDAKEQSSNTWPASMKRYVPNVWRECCILLLLGGFLLVSVAVEPASSKVASPSPHAGRALLHAMMGLLLIVCAHHAIRFGRHWRSCRCTPYPQLFLTPSNKRLAVAYAAMATLSGAAAVGAFFSSSSTADGSSLSFQQHFTVRGTLYAKILFVTLVACHRAGKFAVYPSHRLLHEPKKASACCRQGH